MLDRVERQASLRIFMLKPTGQKRNRKKKQKKDQSLSSKLRWLIFIKKTDVNYSL